VKGKVLMDGVLTEEHNADAYEVITDLDEDLSDFNKLLDCMKRKG